MLLFANHHPGGVAWGLSSSASTRPISVAIIGGGVAGLSCAERLCQGNSNDSNGSAPTLFDVTVFDTGRLRPGGRCSSRQPGDPPKEKHHEPMNPILSRYRYDHAAQIVTVPSSSSNNNSNNPLVYADFAQQVQQWEKDGILTPFPPQSVYHIGSHQKMDPIDTSNSSSSRMYYGTHGMGSIPQAMVQNNSNGGRFRIRQDVWVSPSNGVKYLPDSSQWRVQAGGRVLGVYDRLVVAHNGKCADRLMSQTPAKRLHALLRVNFAPTVAAHGGHRMTLNSIYSLTWACRRRPSKEKNQPQQQRSSSSLSSLSQHLPDNFVAGFVHNHPALRFLTCQTRKYPAKDSDVDDADDIEVWTVLSSPTFAKKHKAPQEFLPEETVETVSKLLWSAVQEAVTGPPVGDSNADDWKKDVLDSRLQLWGAAVPVNVWCSSSSRSGSSGGGGDETEEKDLAPAGFLYDAPHAVGACGDWLQEPSIAGAWTSGRRLAEHMLHDASSSHGLLSGSFQKSESTAQAGIGALSTAKTTTSTRTTATRRTAKKKKKTVQAN